MRSVLEPRDMRALEQRYMEKTGIASIDLMERAALSVVRTMQLIAGAQSRLAIFACGPGGNGGDGFAAARLHAQRFGKSIILPLCGEDALSGDARINFTRAQETPGVAFASLDELTRLPVPATWVDAMYGIGLSRPLDEALRPLVERMAADRAQGARVLAIDIASGLNAYTGRAMGAAVAATDTVTFECAKPGHLLEDGLDLTGKLTIQSIGIGADMFPPCAIAHVDMTDVRAALRPRARNSHKGTYGHLLVVAGSMGMAGAAILTTQAALRSGAGLVTVACPRSIVPILQMHAPCAICLPLPEVDGVIAPEALECLQEALVGKRAVAMGPGLSNKIDPSLVEAVLTCALPAVLDADALNVIAQNPKLRAHLSPRHLLTPHPGEAARLLGEAAQSPIDGARAIHALGCVALYKGAGSVIVGEGTTIRTSGCAGLSKGGSGDVLTGLLGALLAQGYAPEQAAWMGAVTHGVAGEQAALAGSEMGMTAEDLIDCLRLVWRDAQ